MPRSGRSTGFALRSARRNSRACPRSPARGGLLVLVPLGLIAQVPCGIGEIVHVIRVEGVSDLRAIQLRERAASELGPVVLVEAFLPRDEDPPGPGRPAEDGAGTRSSMRCAIE